MSDFDVCGTKRNHNTNANMGCLLVLVKRMLHLQNYLCGGIMNVECEEICLMFSTFMQKSLNITNVDRNTRMYT